MGAAKAQSLTNPQRPGDLGKKLQRGQMSVAVRLDDGDIDAAVDFGLLRDRELVNTDEKQVTYGVAYDNKRNVCADLYDSRDALQKRCREFASSRGFSLRVHDTSFNKQTQEGNAKYVCKLLKGQQQLDKESAPACPFSINVYGKDGKWKITKIQFLHDHYMHGGFQASAFMESSLHSSDTSMRQRDVSFATLLGLVERDMLPAYADSWHKVTGVAIMDWLLTREHTISRQTASKIKLTLAERMRGDIVQSYQKLEDYLAQAAAANAGSHYAFDKDGSTFLRACFFPSACLKAQRHCKNVIGLDGAHLKGEMNKRGVFLVATTKDFDNHIIVFGLALVPVENYDHWHWFLSHMRLAFGTREGPSPLFVSDRQKGLLASVAAVYPESGHRFCVRHIIGNIAKLGMKVTDTEQGYIFAMARAESESEFEVEAKKLEETRPKAVEYLRSIDRAHWVTYVMNEDHGYVTYDEVTSNMSESANNWVGNDCRSSQPLHAFEQYMIKIVKQFAERRNEAAALIKRTSQVDNNTSSTQRVAENSGHLDADAVVRHYTHMGLTPFYESRLASLMKMTKACEVVPCLDMVYLVRFTDPSARPGHVHLWRSVNLQARECHCHKWQDMQFPCVHAVQAAVRNGTHITELFDFEKHSAAAYVQTYNYQFIPVFSTATLHQDTTLAIPVLQVSDSADTVGKRGKKPGPKSKHKRKTAKVGSASKPTVAMQ